MTKFCRKINPTCKTSWVSVKPTSNAVPNQCYYNVRDYICEHGGAIVFGWAIWEAPDYYIEAEHHAILKTNTQYIDLTPKQDDESRILFLHDPRRSFRFKKPQWRVNIRKSISTDTNVEVWLKAQTKLDRFLLKNTRPDGRHRKTEIKHNQLGCYHLLKVEADAALLKLSIC